MKVLHSLSFASITLLMLLIACAETRAKKLGARQITNSPVQQAAQAQVIVLGTVTAIEPDILKISQSPGGEKVNYLVAVVKINESLLGTRGVTHIRVGFVATAQNGGYYDNEMAFNGRRYYGGNYSVSLHDGQQGCFFLVKHHEGDFYTFPQYSAPLNKSITFFEDELNQVKKVVKVLKTPVEMLKAKESTDRQFAAAILLQRYRTAPQVNGIGKNAQVLKTAAVEKEQNKLILAGLGEMTWGDTGIDGRGNMSLQTLFWQLGLTEKDGWRQPTVKENEDYNTVMDGAFKKWVKEGSSKYQLQRYIVERKKTTE